ncbi:hypothetical protein [Thermomonospora umbrina]|uniref:hypothetical protein n=1 Tax=Thermomonospora umbrina TaxID=111806 RepID=UPI0011C1384D|nr:hypothetical protein [Thermomonospora umbrina]
MALNQSIRDHGGMACGLVQREGRQVVYVINSELPVHRADIGCEFVDAVWWFTWVEDGEPTIGPADDVEGVVVAIAKALKVMPRSR